MKPRTKKTTDLVRGHSGNKLNKEKLQVTHAYTQPSALMQPK